MLPVEWTRKFSPAHADAHQLGRDLRFGGNWKSNLVSALGTSGTLGGEWLTAEMEG